MIGTAMRTIGVIALALLLAILMIAVIAWPVILVCVFWSSMVAPWNVIALVATMIYEAIILWR